MKDPFLSFELTPDEQYSETNSFCHSALEEWTAGYDSTLCPKINPDATGPGRFGPAGLNFWPEKKRIDFVEFSPQISFQQPDLGLTIDFNLTSDFDFGLEGYSSLSFRDEPWNTAPTVYKTSSLEDSYRLSSDGSTP